MTITIKDIEETAKKALKVATGVDPDFKHPQKADERILLDDWELGGTDIKVRAVKPIKSKDVSGQTSQNATVETGIKAYNLNVSLVISNTDREQLTQLTEKVNAVDENGNRIVYLITNTVANSMHVTKVRFSDYFSVTDSKRLAAWNIAFTLQEVDSVSARAEIASNAATPEASVTQSALGEVIESEAAQNIKNASLEGFEKLLKIADDYFKPDETD